MNPLSDRDILGCLVLPSKSVREVEPGDMLVETEPSHHAFIAEFAGPDPDHPHWWLILDGYDNGFTLRPDDETLYIPKEWLKPKSVEFIRWLIRREMDREDRDWGTF